MISFRFSSLTVDQKQLLGAAEVTLAAGDICYITGVNGSGKSSLLHALSGNPAYMTHDLSLVLNGHELNNADAAARARAGMFFISQYAPVIPGLTVSRFLHEVATALSLPMASYDDFSSQAAAALEAVGLPAHFLSREVGVGFSGGERKRFELAQLLICKPSVILLDEIDSGLDKQALAILGKQLQQYHEQHPETIIIIVTHYAHLLHHLPATTALRIHKGELASLQPLALTEYLAGVTHG